jgi:dipeptidase E
MVRLVMYSDQVIPENGKVDARLLDLIAGHGRRVGYVSSGPEPDQRFFNGKQAYYAKLGLDLSVFMDVAKPVKADHLAALRECDAIHLPGGDTRAFLHFLRVNGLVATLGDWTRHGGLLIGTSAGAMLMTPTVALDAVFTGEDPKTVRDAGALNLVPFEFFPHFERDTDHLQQLLAYSTTTARRIAACRDGDGIVVTDAGVESVGDIVWIENGVIIAP